MKRLCGAGILFCVTLALALSDGVANAQEVTVLGPYKFDTTNGPVTILKQSIPGATTGDPPVTIPGEQNLIVLVASGGPAVALTYSYIDSRGVVNQVGGTDIWVPGSSAKCYTCCDMTIQSGGGGSTGTFYLIFHTRKKGP